MKKFKRLLALVMAVTMLAGMVPANVMPVEAMSWRPTRREQTQESVQTLALENESRASSEEPLDAAIIFTDLHTSKNDYKDEKNEAIQNIFGVLKSTGLPFSSVTSGGDAFSVNEDDSRNNGPYDGNIKTISDAIRNTLGNTEIPVNYVWSDHDRYAYYDETKTQPLEKTSRLVYGAGADKEYGTADDDNYYVYALSMGDLCSFDRYNAGFGSDRAGFSKDVATAIANFEADALKLKKDRPLFIVSHQPLFDRRNDNAFAEQWFDAINKVAENMDVAFFFGHNHKYDQSGDYYYAKGSMMPVATADKWNNDYEIEEDSSPSVDLSSESKELKFTHMCAGYMDPHSTGSYSSSTTRENTAVAIAIYKDSIHFKTYGAGSYYKSNYVLDEIVKRDHAIVEPEVVPADKTALETAIAKAEMLVAEDYVDFTAVAEALAAAKTVAADESATQEAVDAAVTALNEAVDALEIKPEEPDTPVVPEDIEIEIDGTIITVSGATEATGSSEIPSADQELINEKGYEDIRIFDINATIPNGKAILKFPVPTEWQDKIDRIVGISIENGVVREIEGIYADGFYAFEVSHFSTKGIALVAEAAEVESGEWKELIAPIPGTEATPAKTTYKYILDTDGVNAGEKYLIVNTSNDGTAYALTNNDGDADRTKVTISNGEIIVDNNEEDINWTFSGSASGTIENQGRYIYPDSRKLSLNTSTSNLTISNSNGSYQIYRTDTQNRKYYLRYNSGWTGTRVASYSSTTYSVYLFKYEQDIVTPGTEATEDINGTYGKIVGNMTYNVRAGMSKEDAMALVKEGVDGYYYEAMSTPESSVTGTKFDDSALNWEWVNAYDGNVKGDYLVKISYHGKELGTVTVAVPESKVEDVTISGNEGTVQRGKIQITGAYLNVTYDNGNTVRVSLNVSMLSDSDAYKTIGTYEKLTVTYKDYEFGNFTLHVVEGNNYPEYPYEGAVKVNKTASGVDFQSSGVAKIELSASGIPSKKGVDVILMLDTSSSMAKDENKINYEDGTSKKRSEVLEESLEDLITQFKTPGEDGELLDIRIAIADFNGYYGNGVTNGQSGTPYDRTSGDYVRSDNSTGSGYDQKSEAQVYTGSKALNAGAFVPAIELETKYTLNYTSGTNYDYAFDAIYQLGTAIKAANTEERDLYVIFMSDGAALQWNYFGSQNGYDKWNNWLTGAWDADALTTSNLNSTTHSYFYDLNDHDGDKHINEHRMANAIKGDPSSKYEIIRKSTAGLPEGTLTAVEGKDYLYTVPGLGATMYTINFDAKQDGDILEENIDKALSSTASDSVDGAQYYYKVTKAEELAAAFNNIGSEIAYAATNARFVDQMGDNFNLQMRTESYSTLKLDANGNTVDENGDEEPDLETKLITPAIEIITYDIYTADEAATGKIPSGKNIGDRKGTYTLQEVVIFNEDGTKAYSNLIDVDNDGTFGVTVTTKKDGEPVYKISDTGDDILGTDGIIDAKTFIYNTKVESVAVEGVMIPTGNGLETTNKLPSETFYWKIGTVQTKELAMRYYVYLEGAMAGTKPAGSYATNEYAILYYDNYLGNACEKPTVSPTMPWKSANVSYAFYLVDENGNIIVNQTTGQTGSFANKVAVTNPVVYDEIYLNNTEQVQSINVAAISGDVLPKYYTLYDSGAKYTITINSNSTGAWTITNGGKPVNSTYVTHYTADGSAYSNALSNDTVGHDYTHTIVWFAVVWSIEAHPDTVVIDYGIPVDISVLANDMFGDYGKLEAVGAYNANLETITSGASLAEGFTTSTTGLYGTVSANIETGKVRYTPSKMEMNGYDKFTYAVNYKGPTNMGYYYDAVTVIPATTIYYEDSFVKFETLEWNDENSTWDVDADAEENNKSAWVQVTEEIAPNTTQTEYLQQEDRPGQYSITDANNIYGYDAVNKNKLTYSLGSAQKATANASRAAQASFKFYGTGFDIIGLTDSTTGTIFLDVYPIDADGVRGTAVSNTFVDTYYGYTKEMHEIVYTYTNGEWISKDNGKTESTTSGSRPEAPEEGSTYTAIEAVWKVAENTENAIYQVPVMEVEGLDYGRYEVVIRVVYNDFFAHSSSGAYNFYLDAIRIYDPANDGAADKTIENAYVADHEGWPSYLELRNGLIDQETLGNSETNTVIEGLVFIDGNSKVGDEENELSDYENYGPNNEVYIAPGQRVAFMLDTPENIDKVRIGIKSADGEVGTYTITNIAKVDKTDGSGVKAGKWYNARTYTIDTSTDMYYDLTEWKDDIIVISNTGGGGEDRYNTTGIISLTNIKSTYTSNPSNEVTAFPEQEETENETVMYMTPAVAMLTLRSLNTPVEEPTVPEEEVTTPEVEIFVPEKLEVKVHKGKVKTGEKVKVTVTTSSDVEAIEINGSEITNFKVAKHGDRKWESNIIAETVGTLEITVVAKDADGNSSDPITDFVEVSKKVFNPKKFDVKLQKNKVKVGQKVKVTVTTSSEVEVIEINGREITNFKAKGIHERTWETTITAEAAGTLEVTVVAKSKDGNSSKPSTKVIEVTAKKGK